MASQLNCLTPLVMGAIEWADPLLIWLIPRADGALTARIFPSSMGSWKADPRHSEALKCFRERLQMQRLYICGYSFGVDRNVGDRAECVDIVMVLA